MGRRYGGYSSSISWLNAENRRGATNYDILGGDLRSVGEMEEKLDTTGTWFLLIAMLVFL